MSGPSDPTVASMIARLAASGAVIGLCCVAGLAACAAGSGPGARRAATSGAPAPIDPGKVLGKRCGRCHVVETIRGYQKTPEQWERTINRMRGEMRASVSDAEAAALRDYLSAGGK